MSAVLAPPLTGFLMHDARAVIDLLLPTFAPTLMVHLAEHVRWTTIWALQGAVAAGRAREWAAWEQLLWALETVGDIEVKRGEDGRYGWIFIRISASGFLKEALHEQDRS